MSFFVRRLSDWHNDGPIAATLGNFDGVHLGHQALLGALVSGAAQRKLPSVVITFAPTPNQYFAKQKIEMVQSLRDRVVALRQAGVDRVLCLPFNPKIAGLSPERFVKDILVDILGVRYFCRWT